MHFLKQFVKNESELIELLDKTIETIYECASSNNTLRFHFTFLYGYILVGVE